MLPIPEFYHTLGTAIRKIRRTAHLTQKDLAAAIGKSTAFLGHVERGTRKMSLETLLAIVVALRIEPNALFAEIVPDDVSEAWKRSKLERLAAALSHGDGEPNIVAGAMDALKKALSWLSLVAEMEKQIEQSGDTE